MKIPDAENDIFVATVQPFSAQLGEGQFTNSESLFKEFFNRTVT